MTGSEMAYITLVSGAAVAFMALLAYVSNES
jgi:hypothetical protein